MTPTQRILVALLSTLAPACGGLRVSDDPKAEVYRRAGTEFSRFPTVKLNFVSVKTSDGTDVDHVRQVFRDSLMSHLQPRFRQVVEGTSGGAGDLIVEIELNAWWIDRAAATTAMFVPYEAGRGSPGMQIEYRVKSANGELLARYRKGDIEAFAYLRPAYRTFVEEYAEEWNQQFAEELLVGSPSAPARDGSLARSAR